MMAGLTFFLAAAAGMAIASPAPVQDSAPASQAAASATVAPVTDAEIGKLADGIIMAQNVMNDTSVPAADKEAKEIAAITAAGITPARYKEITTLAQNDPQLGQKLGAAIQAKMTAGK